MPLQCGPKEFLSCATLLWAVRQRPYAKWDTIARWAGVRRRTLERYSVRLTNCTLAAAGRDPGMVQRRFEEWVREVSAVETPPVGAAPVLGDHRPQHDVTDVHYRIRTQRQHIYHLTDLLRVQPVSSRAAPICARMPV